MRRIQRPSRVVALLAAALMAGCATLLSDSDGSPGDARALDLNAGHADRLACQSQRRPDCIDWFALELPEAGEIRLEVTASGPEDPDLDYTESITDDGHLVNVQY